MNKSEEKLTSRELKKAKIRERYKGINQDEIEVIPALPQIRLDDPNRTQRVAGHGYGASRLCRGSSVRRRTDDQARTDIGRIGFFH